MKKRLLFGLVVITLGALAMHNNDTLATLTGLDALTSPAASSDAYSDNFHEGKFHNSIPTLASAGMGKILKSFLFDKNAAARPDKAIPLQPMQSEQLLSDDRNAVYRLGHSTVLIRFEGDFWLTDPVFSERASPVQWAGPKRFHPAPIEMEQLPPIKGVLISHNHYDHLDEGSIKALHSRVEHFYTPLGVGRQLKAWGVPAEKITELDWWSSVKVGPVTLAATPAQHFSGRGLFDGNTTLWASWVMLGSKERLFFSGDSGYFPGFKEIGDKYGPFDLTMIETGAYNQNWPGVHMHPEESIQAHIDLQGKQMMPIHNSTFDLAMHAWYDPLERIAALARERQVTLRTPMIGAPLVLSEPAQQTYWWRDLMPAQAEATEYADKEPSAQPEYL
ncbi:MBL fold metallo-hydrolase [Hahella aquimaris]|uniref:MBL fold metallo-hydrolase n=1 Tax=Hahella sp. HNIBRBA332 TaxID=3015983 RepID=UPI00273C44DD|nr:MBL fold metallo-hydrolase [Hahella sp. HNIBRBA332]WLQ16194.1 MBL fold metallo-hydrolase [Hahella sp. HNIBRBA332]